MIRRIGEREEEEGYPPEKSKTARFQGLWVGGKGGKAPTTKNAPKWRILDV